MHRLRIAVYTDSTGVGGAEHALAQLITHLGDALDVVPIFVSEAVARAVAPEHEAALVRRPSEKVPDPSALRAHIRALRAAHADVFHANLISPYSGQYGLAAAIALRIPTVAVYQLPNDPANRLQHLLKRATARGTTAHVGVGERVARDIERRLGLRSGTALTIHNGVDDRVPQPPGRTDGGPTIGAVGRLAPQKGFDVLLRALVRIPGVRLVIVGDGPDRAELERLSRELGVADRTSFAGWIDEPRNLLRSFDVLAVPSRNEGFPLTVLEGLLAEVAVVATDVGSVSEAVVPGETGALVEPEDVDGLAAALHALLADPEERQRLGRRGRELVLARFTAAHMATAFERLYRELAA